MGLIQQMQSLHSQAQEKQTDAFVYFFIRLFDCKVSI